MAKHLATRSAWMSGLRRAESDSRRDAAIVSHDSRGLVKINPLATWSDAQVDAYIAENDVPVNPMLFDGYPSIGCWPCTRRCRSRRRRSRRSLGRFVQDRMWVEHMTLTEASPTTIAPAAALDHLDALESHAIFIIREVAAELRNPVVLFSGGKDSVVVLHLVAKALAPAPFPFAVMHVDTGHNFQEVLDFRDLVVSKLGARLVVASVQQSIDRGRCADPGAGASRNRLQSVSLLDAIAEHGFDACFGGARRDEDKARARSASSRSVMSSGSGILATSAPSCGTCTTGVCGRASTCAPFRSATGPSSTSGGTSSARTSISPRSTSLTSVRSSPGTACSSR